MRWILAIGVLIFSSYWVYEKYQVENRYIEMQSPEGEVSVLDRALIGLQRQNELELDKDEVVIQKFQRGEISFDRYTAYFEKKRDQEKREEEDAIEAMGKMFDPEKGMFSGAFKMAALPSFQKDKQQKELEEKINTILKSAKIRGSEETIILLSAIAWTSVGDNKIDTEMSHHYQTKIDRLVRQIKNTGI